MSIRREDLVTGELSSGACYENAVMMSKEYPQIPFPLGWKANLNGVDLNLQYPAGWENARDIKYAQGFSKPGPRDFVGPGPLSEPESLALYSLTQAANFSLTLSYHTQGKVIYWKYLDYEPKNSYETAKKIGALSGYDVEETPIASGYAGDKDWFISLSTGRAARLKQAKGLRRFPYRNFPRFTRITSGCWPKASVLRNKNNNGRPQSLSKSRVIYCLHINISDRQYHKWKIFE